MSWYADADTDPDNAYIGFKDYAAVNVWGQVFAVQDGSANIDVRLQARDPQVWFLRSAGWERGAEPSGGPGKMGGEYYPGDFTQHASIPVEERDEGDGIYSCSLNRLNETGIDAYHWWWNGQYPRISIPADCQGIVVRMDVRIVPEDGYSTTANAQFVCSIDCDLFATPETTVGGPNGNPGLPEARMKWVTGEWQHFYNTTLSIVQINHTTPPLS